MAVRVALRLPRPDRPDPAAGHETAVRPAGDVLVVVHAARPEADDDARALLSEAERTRHDRLHHAVDRDRLAAGRRVLRHALAARGGIPPDRVAVRTAPAPGLRPSRHAGGRPVVPGGPRGISIAHGGRLVLVALCTEHAVGVDVEPRASATRMPEVAGTLLGPDERRALEERVRSRPADGPGALERELLRAWTRKEALLKAAGVGLTVSPSAILLAPDGGPRVLATGDGLPPAERFVLCDLDAGPDHVAALAVLRDG